MSTTSDNGAGPPEPGAEIDKHGNVGTVSPGGPLRYTITTRNYGRAFARNLLVCDGIPGEETFLSADHRLLGIGRRRCLVINNRAPGQQVTLHLIARVNRNARAGRIDNGTAETPGVEPPEPPLGPPAPPIVPGPPLAPNRDIQGDIAVPKPRPEGGQRGHRASGATATSCYRIAGVPAPSLPGRGMRETSRIRRTLSTGRR